MHELGKILHAVDNATSHYQTGFHGGVGLNTGFLGEVSQKCQVGHASKFSPVQKWQDCDVCRPNNSTFLLGLSTNSDLTLSRVPL